jgi:hypothetical protein
MSIESDQPELTQTDQSLTSFDLDSEEWLKIVRAVLREAEDEIYKQMERYSQSEVRPGLMLGRDENDPLILSVNV